jgi:hypothetical protein
MGLATVTPPEELLRELLTILEAADAAKVDGMMRLMVKDELH